MYNSNDIAVARGVGGASVGANRELLPGILPGVYGKICYRCELDGPLMLNPTPPCRILPSLDTARPWPFRPFSFRAPPPPNPTINLHLSSHRLLLLSFLHQPFRPLPSTLPSSLQTTSKMSGSGDVQQAKKSFMGMPVSSPVAPRQAPSIMVALHPFWSILLGNHPSPSGSASDRSRPRLLPFQS